MALVSADNCAAGTCRAGARSSNTCSSPPPNTAILFVRGRHFKHSNKCMRVQNQSTSGAAQVIQDTCRYVPERGLFLIE